MPFDSWVDFLSWLQVNQIGDLTGLLGIIVSILGFFVTVWSVLKSKKAAVLAAEAATAAYNRIAEFESVFDFSAAIASLEEIKRLHRQKAWQILPDRYAALRKTLISLRASIPSLQDQEKSIIQNALVNLRDIEQRVERSLADGTSLSGVKFNYAISEDIDSLMSLLSSIKTAQRRR